MSTFSEAAAHRLLSGRRALITGAAGGIGAAIADAFEAAGASVTRLDLRASGSVAACDVTSDAAVAAAFAEAEGAGPVFDVVHAAGILTLGSVSETTTETFRQAIEVNLIGGFIVGREAGRRLPPGGNLVFIASQAGLKGGALWGAYSAAKAGLLRLADCLAEELGERGVRVNSISPGNVNTAMVDAALKEIATRSGHEAATIRSGYEQAIPMRRFADPEEIGNVAVALCSGLMSYVNGANIVVDGGELSR